MSLDRKPAKKRVKRSTKNDLTAVNTDRETILDGTAANINMLCCACLSPQAKPMPAALALVHKCWVRMSPRHQTRVQLGLCASCAHLMRKYVRFQNQCKMIHEMLAQLRQDQLTYAYISESIVKDLNLQPPLTISHNLSDNCIHIQYENDPEKTIKDTLDIGYHNLVELDIDKVKEETDDANCVVKPEVGKEVGAEEVDFLEFPNDDYESTDDEPLSKKSYLKPSTEQKKLTLDKYTKTTLSAEQQKSYFMRRRQSLKYQRSEYRCDVCWRGFKDRESLDLHCIVHSDKIGVYVCPVCEYRFPDKNKLRTHMLSHKYIFKCKMCPYVTQHRQVLTDHLRKHQGKLFTCQYCGNIYNHRSTYLNHRRARHSRGERVPGVEGGEGGRCGVCGGARGEGQQLDPREISENGSRCKQCATPIQETAHTDKQLTHPEKFQRMKCRRKTRTISCELCCRTYLNRSDYERHYSEAHPKEHVPKKIRKTVLCEECGKMFQCRALLEAHKQSHASGAGRGGGAHRCDECGSSFTTKTTLTYHRMKHKGFSYNCNLCGKKFSHPSNRLRHVKYYHTEARNEGCSFCDKRFKSAACLRAHVDRVHRHSYPSATRAARPARARARDNK